MKVVNIRRVGDRLAQVRQEVHEILSGKRSPEPNAFLQAAFGRLPDSQLPEDEINDSTLDW